MSLDCDEEILKKFTSFVNILYKIVKDELKVQQVIFTKYLDDESSVIKEKIIKPSKEEITKDFIGIRVKKDKRISEDVLILSYFINYYDLEKFFDNVHNNICRLYSCTEI